MEMEWNPIETVPLDKAVLIAIPPTEYWPRWMLTTARLLSQGGEWLLEEPGKYADAFLPSGDPTYWMVLPDPPTSVPPPGEGA